MHFSLSLKYVCWGCFSSCPGIQPGSSAKRLEIAKHKDKLADRRVNRIYEYNWILYIYTDTVTKHQHLAGTWRHKMVVLDLWKRPWRPLWLAPQCSAVRSLKFICDFVKFAHRLSQSSMKEQIEQPSSTSKCKFGLHACSLPWWAYASHLCCASCSYLHWTSVVGYATRSSRSLRGLNFLQFREFSHVFTV